MIVRKFARPYAKAIVDVAGAPEKADSIRAALAKFNEARHASGELREVFANPGIEVEAKIAIADRIAGRLAIEGLSKKVIEVLIRNHRINDLDAIVDALEAFVNEATNTVVADVTSAHELSGGELASLRQTLETKFGKRVDVRVTTDPNLLGGFVARVGSEIFNASVAGKIEKFRESLT